MFSAEVQADLKPETVEMGTVPDADVLAEALKEMEANITKELEMKEQLKRKSIGAIMDSSGGQAVGGDTGIPKPPKTAKARTTTKFGFADLDQRKSPEGGATAFSFREQSQMEYLIKRDPMQEFFTLTCQSVKLNSPHMNAVCTIDTMQLYKKAIKQNIPFFEWQTWIEDVINKEFFRVFLARSFANSNQKKSKGASKQAEADAKRKAKEQAMYFQDQVEEDNVMQLPRKGQQAAASAATRKTRGRSGHSSKSNKKSYVRPGLQLQIDTSDDLAFGEADSPEDHISSRRTFQPPQSAKSQLQSADKKGGTRYSFDDKDIKKASADKQEKPSEAKSKKVGQTPKPRKLLKGLSLFK